MAEVHRLPDFKIRGCGIEQERARFVGMPCAGDPAQAVPAWAIQALEIQTCLFPGGARPEELVVVFLDQFGVTHYLAMAKAPAEALGRRMLEVAQGLGGIKHEPEVTARRDG